MNTKRKFNTIKDDKILKHEEQRINCWVRAWAATASATNCNKSATAIEWADKALAAFDIRFPSPRKI